MALTKIDHLHDTQRLQAILLIYGYESTLADCQEIWEKVSGAMDAQWLYVEGRNPEDVKEMIEQYANHLLL